MKKFKVAIIGAGRVGSAFAKELKKHQFEIEIVIDKNIQSARKLAKKIQTKNCSDNISALPPDIELLILTVPDNFIRSTAEEIASLKIFAKKKFAFHTSGSLSSDELSTLQDKGFDVFSFHPNLSFATTEKNYSFKDVYCVIESSSDKALKFGKFLCKKIGSIPVILSPDQKKLYHAFSVMISNYTTTLFYFIEKTFQNSDLKKSYLKLLDITLKNIEHLSPSMALTGPISRGDWLAVNRNLESLKSLDKRLAKIYSLYGLLTLEIVENKGKIDKKILDNIKNMLEIELP